VGLGVGAVGGVEVCGGLGVPVGAVRGAVRGALAVTATFTAPPGPYQYRSGTAENRATP